MHVLLVRKPGPGGTVHTAVYGPFDTETAALTYRQRVDAFTEPGVVTVTKPVDAPPEPEVAARGVTSNDWRPGAIST